VSEASCESIHDRKEPKCVCITVTRLAIQNMQMPARYAMQRYGVRDDVEPSVYTGMTFPGIHRPLSCIGIHVRSYQIARQRVIRCNEPTHVTEQTHTHTPRNTIIQWTEAPSFNESGRSGWSDGSERIQDPSTWAGTQYSWG
jgi:hypothetical protein